MDETERREKYLRQTETIYASIGRFAVKFEYVVHAMQRCVLQSLQRNGLISQPMAHAVMAGLTADPMTRMFGAVVADGRKADFAELDRKIMADILKRIRALTEIRNDIIHRTWFVGWASAEETTFDKTSSWKFKNSKVGTEFAPLEHEAVDFEKHSATADQLVELINRVSGCMILDQPISKNFL